MNVLLELCDALCVEPEVLARFSSTAPHRYKVYTIPKRNGKGRRTIAHPSKELKYVQRALLGMLQEVLPVHSSAMAYKKGVGVRDNAMIHVRSSYLLKMDFSDFFPSITPELFFKVLANKGIEFSAEDKTFLKGILFWKPVRKGGLVLSIGAPTSPFVSNTLLNGFDHKINETCSAQDILYTRYADDLTFSTNTKGALFSIPNLVNEVLKSELLEEVKINRDKTVFSSKAHNRHVTGITITNESKLSIGRERKRNISAAIHNFSHGKLTDDETLSLQGTLSFAKHVEPVFYGRLQRKYGKDVIDKLLAYKKVLTR